MGGSSNDSGGDYNTTRSDRRKREEAALKRASFMSGKKSYAESSSGNIIRSSSGSGVLTRAGVERQQAFRQEELERTISQQNMGQGDPRQQKRDLAARQLQQRLDKTIFPGTLGAIQAANLRKQIADLKAGRADPQFNLGTSGNFVATGVRRVGDNSGMAMNIKGDVGRNRDVGGDRTPEVTPEITGEFAPDDTSSIQTALLSGGSKTRRTKFKRSGQASDLAGTGVLVRTTTA